MPNKSILQVGQRIKAAQDKRAADVTKVLLRDWRKIAKSLRQRLKVTMKKIEASIKETGSPSASLEYQKRHIQTLLNEVTAAMDSYADHVNNGITERQPKIITQAQTDAVTLSRAVMPAQAAITTTWAHVNPSHLKVLSERLRPGGKVDEALHDIAPKAATKLADAIKTRVAMGEQVQSVAKDFDDALGGAAAQYMTIARTEDMNAYRTSQTDFFKENDDIYESWQWMASLEPRTCPACLAMHGSVHPLTEHMDSHFSCACVALPIIKGFGADEMESGEDWLKKQPEETQLKVLGRGKYELWKDDKIALADTVTHSHHDLIGGMYHEATLAQTLANAEKNKD